MEHHLASQHPADKSDEDALGKSLTDIKKLENLVKKFVEQSGSELLITECNLCRGPPTHDKYLSLQLESVNNLPIKITILISNKKDGHPLARLTQLPTHPFTNVFTLTATRRNGDTTHQASAGSTDRSYQKRTIPKDDGQPTDDERPRAQNNLKDCQCSNASKPPPLLVTSQKTGVEEKPQKTMVDRLPAQDRWTFEQQPAETEDSKQTEEKLEHEKALKDLYELRPADAYTSGQAYIVASYLENYNPALPVPLQQQLDRMSPREFRSYLLDRVSSEQREALLLDEGQRRRTFLSDWPHSGDNLSGPTMAKAGLYYLGYSDRVQCVFCRGQLFRWEENDVAMVEHARLFNFCRFVKNLPTGNIEYQPRTLTSSDLQQVTLFTEQPEPDNVSMGISTIRAATLRYAPANARMQTYDRWTLGETQAAARLSEAGFYYTGQGDFVRCFFCGGGLKEWSATDDPWEEHAAWFPNCLFLIDKKGQEFINAAYNRAPEGRRGEPPTARQPENARTQPTRLGLSQEMDRILQEMGHSRQAIEEVTTRNGGPFDDIREMIDALYTLEESCDLEVDGAVATNVPTERVAETSRQPTFPVREISESSEHNDCRRCLARENVHTAATNIGLPCGHLIFCDACKEFESRQRRSLPDFVIQCPYPRCGAPLIGAMRVYFA